jgi:D-sedoheptulose 7-phosphate isomerase
VSDFFPEYFASIYKHCSEINIQFLQNLVSAFGKVKASQGKVIIVGKGGSAAISSHVSVDLTKAAGVRATNFNEADLLTCFSNDFGYEQWVARALEFYADQQDCVVLISSSGKSPNIVNGALQAVKMDLSVFGLTGFDKNNPVNEVIENHLWVPSTNYNTIEMTHQIALLAAVDKYISIK